MKYKSIVFVYDRCYDDYRGINSSSLWHFFLIESKGLKMMKIENLDEELAKLTISDYDCAGEMRRLLDYVANEDETINKKLSTIDLIREDNQWIEPQEAINA